MEEEQDVSLSELKALLEQEERDRTELSTEQRYALTHAQTFVKLDREPSVTLIKELMEVEMMTLPNAFKLADLLPTHPDDVRAVFAKERFSLAPEDVDRVVEIVAKYL